MSNLINFRLTFLFLLLSHILFSQQEGDKWVFGYYGYGNENFSIIHMAFNDGIPSIELHFEEKMRFYGTCSNICDQSGNVELLSNGMEIFGRRGIEVSDTIAYDSGDNSYWNFYFDDYHNVPLGFFKHDGALILPLPDIGNQYSVLYHKAERHPDHYYAVSSFLEARVQVNEDSTYTVLFQDSLIGQHHQWYTDRIEAVRHANGRDWWIVIFESNTAKYYSFLLNPTGIILEYAGETESVVTKGLGQSAFSPFGNFLARVDVYKIVDGQTITLYSFDRCTGHVNQVESFHTTAGYFSGVAFSPSERFLYADDNENLWQWDLWSEDISASKTLIDTFDGFVQPGWYATMFGPMTIAPDGRIYIVPPSGSSEYMHVIDRPDLPGRESRLLQHHINLTVPNGRSAPNLPNFRLGPLDGSPCDTLGLNNHPVARWRYEEAEYGWIYDVRFTDLSFFNPEMWQWDFGDGETSEEMSPVHHFEPGFYHVCLTVSNAYATDSNCQWIEILTTSTPDENESARPDLYISPNPFTDDLIIQSRSGTWRSAKVMVYDMHGSAVIAQEKLPVPITIKAPSLPSGLYMVVIYEDDGSVVSQKVMKR